MGLYILQKDGRVKCLAILFCCQSSSKGIIAKDIDKIGEVLEIEPEIRTSVVAGLVKIICKSKDNGTFISPLRTHLFFRNVSGIWGCSDPHCPHVNEKYRFEGRSIGTMYKRPRNVKDMLFV